MNKSVALLFYCFLFSFVAKAQSSLTLASGFSFDINSPNKKEQFNHIPVSFQWLTSHRKKGGGFLVSVDYSIPVSGTSSGDAYTLNSALPPKVTLQETVHPSLFTVSIGWRFRLFTLANKSSFYFDYIPFGICTQSFKVNYKNYDKDNYDILNPDVNLVRTSIIMSGGFVYKMPLKKEGNNLLFMLHVQSPLAATTGKYDLSYTFVAPLQLMVGYNFNYTKENKNGKEIRSKKEFHY